ncbi:MAG: response regulator [Planctomycetaceae bacterium]|jgi:CheY-like chemotaxis protein|nr:response regulator [Planctomycetaceae bacterium]MBT6153221.1 response regulator [Planctomycetaceae bacterium]MBT6495637.1 response regulator [Planctomycetaceae bacterium]
MTTVLVVDDSPVDCKLAGGLLERDSDWNVVYAANGARALEQIELHIPDLVLTDMQMPEMDGLELVSAVRKEYPLIPVILMTGQGSEEIAVKALQRGAASYVSKRKLALDLVDTVQLVLSAAGDDRSYSQLMNRMTTSGCQFVLENNLSLIASAVQYLQEAVTNLRICDDADRLRVGVALEEALLNAYYHGNLQISSELREQDHRAYYDLARERTKQLPFCERRIYVDARFTPDEAIYVIRDEGEGFDASTIPDPTDPANLERSSGRGRLLMQTFMDEVIYNDVGNQVTCIKRRSLAVDENDGE